MVRKDTYNAGVYIKVCIRELAAKMWHAIFIYMSKHFE